MTRGPAVALAVSGPLCVGLLRFLLPYYTAPDSTATAEAVVLHPGRESAVLWLGLAATLTLVPGLYAVRAALPRGRLAGAGFGLVLVGYLVLPVLLVGDMLLWAGAAELPAPETTARLLDGLHPAYSAGVALFVVAHVLGTVLLGAACLRGGALPVALGWALTLSQPLHFATAVVLGLPWLDLVAWSLTALAMGWLAASAPTSAPRRATVAPAEPRP